jgi:hypothetical protein
MSKWNAGVFLAKARELSGRLRSWHIEDSPSLIRFVTQQQSRHWVRLTFREIITIVGADPRAQPEGWEFSMHDGGEPDEQGCIGEPYPTADRDAEQSLTIWLMCDFQRHLQAGPPLPALDHLQKTFGHILDLPAWTIREPEDVWERSMASYGRDEEGEPRWYISRWQKVL